MIVLILKKLCSIIASQFDVDEESITEKTSFADDLNADSLDLVELMMTIEEEFELGDIDEANIGFIETVGDAEEFIKERIEG